MTRAAATTVQGSSDRDVPNLAAAAEPTERQLSRLIAIGGTIILLGSIPGIAEQLPHFSLWWNAAAALIAAFFPALAVLSTVLPIRVLRACWGGIPALAIGLQAVAFAAVSPEAGGDPFPWVWYLEPAVVTFLVLALRPAPVIGLTLLSGATPALSALYFWGGIPPTVAAATPIHLGNVAFVVLFIGIRARLARLRVAEAEQLAAESRRARAAAEQDRHAAVSLLVHDEVLSVLGAATLFRGNPPEVLRREAANAIAVLLGNAGGRAPAEFIPTQLAAERLLARLRPIVHGVTFATLSDAGSLPVSVVEQLGLAAAEALRNSRKHAGVGARRTVGIELAESRITLRIDDDGVGFDPERVSAGRLGMSESIHARVRGIGGTSTVRAAPGAGVTVQLGWVAV